MKNFNEKNNDIKTFEDFKNVMFNEFNNNKTLKTPLTSDEYYVLTVEVCNVNVVLFNNETRVKTKKEHVIMDDLTRVLKYITYLYSHALFEKVSYDFNNSDEEVVFNSYTKQKTIIEGVSARDEYIFTISKAKKRLNNI